MRRERIVRHLAQRIMKPKTKLLTMDNFASDLGCSKKTLYKHFDSKTELIKAVWDIEFIDIEASFCKSVGKGEALKEHVVQTLYHLHETIAKLSDSMLGPKSGYAHLFWEKYFDIRTDIFEYHLIHAFLPFEDKVLEGFQSVGALVQFLLCTMEDYHFYEPGHRHIQDNKFIDGLIWLVYNSVLANK